MQENASSSSSEEESDSGDRVGGDQARSSSSEDVQFDSYSEIEEIAQIAGVVAAAYPSEIDFADTSVECPTSPTSNSDVDPGLPRIDYLDFYNCTICQTEKKDVSFPYCKQCFAKRKDILPQRSSRKRFKKLSQESSSQESGIESSSGGSSNSQSVDCVDGLMNSGMSVNEICNICAIQPIDAVFLHGRTAHKYACYTCSKKTWKTIKGCPLCRRKLTNVLKLLPIS